MGGKHLKQVIRKLIHALCYAIAHCNTNTHKHIQTHTQAHRHAHTLHLNIFHSNLMLLLNLGQYHLMLYKIATQTSADRCVL